MSQDMKNDAMDQNQKAPVDPTVIEITDAPPPPPSDNQQSLLNTHLTTIQAPIMMSNTQIFDTSATFTNTMKAVSAHLDSMEEVVRSLPRDTGKPHEQNRRHHTGEVRAREGPPMGHIAREKNP